MEPHLADWPGAALAEYRELFAFLGTGFAEAKDLLGVSRAARRPIRHDDPGPLDVGQGWNAGRGHDAA